MKLEKKFQSKRPVPKPRSSKKSKLDGKGQTSTDTVSLTPENLNIPDSDQRKGDITLPDEITLEINDIDTENESNCEDCSDKSEPQVPKEQNVNLITLSPNFVSYHKVIRNVVTFHNNRN